MHTIPIKTGRQAGRGKMTTSLTPCIHPLQPLGEPDQPAQQRWVIQEAFALLEAAEGPGALIEPDGNWEKHSEIVR